MEDHTFRNASNIKVGDHVAFPLRPYVGKNQYIDISLFTQCSVTERFIYYGNQSKNYVENEIAESFNYNISIIPIEIKRRYPKIYEICLYRRKSNRPQSFKRISRIWSIDDFFFLVGVYAAEGSPGNKDGSLKFSGHQQDKWENQNFMFL